MLFAPLRYKKINFAEIGIANGGSVLMWWNYFKEANLFFFDRDKNFLKRITDVQFEANTPSLSIMDVSVDGDIERALKKASSELYDVVLDDSSHNINDQIRIVKESWPLIKPGGYMIVEDIFRNESEEKYEVQLADIIGSCSLAYFAVCNHEERYSPGWNNDKILVLVKGEV